MKLRNLFAILVITSILMTVTVSAQVSTDYDHSTNFKNLKTYSWTAVHTANTLWDKRVKDTVDRELASKGWTELASGGDVQIVAIGKTSVHQEYYTTYDGFGGRRWGGMGDSTTSLDSYKVGTLFVQMFEGSSNQLIWKATSSAALSGNPDKNERKLDKEVHDMFKHFPPDTGA